MTALTDLIEPKTGRTAELWLGYTRGTDQLTGLTVTWDPTSRLGASAAARIDVERLRADGTPDGPAQSVPRKDAVTTPASARFQLSPGKNTLRFTSFDAQGEVLDRWPEDITVPSMSGALALATPRFFLARSAFELRAMQAAKDAVARRLATAAQDRSPGGRARVPTAAARLPSSSPSCSIRRATRW